MSDYVAPLASDGEPCYWCDPANGPCRTHADPPRNDRLADLEALREVTEQWVVAFEPAMVHYWSGEAVKILRRLRGDEPPERDPADYEHEPEAECICEVPGYVWGVDCKYPHERVAS